MFVINRRQFAHLTAAGLVAWNRSLSAADAVDGYDPTRPMRRAGKKLVVQPVLIYRTQERKEATSWRSWGSVNNPESAAEERQRIEGELRDLAAHETPLLDILPLRAVTTEEEAKQVHDGPHDVVLIYPATGARAVLLACFAQNPAKDTLIFARHQSGPVYYWYEALSTSFLKKGTAEDFAACNADNHGPVTVNDVVIDDYGELRWRLAALAALRNFVGHRILALGGAQGKYDASAPQVARERFRFDIFDVSYDDLGRRLAALRSDTSFLARAEEWTDHYLAIPGTRLQTDRRFIVNAFFLYKIFKDWMREHETPAITINQCMGTIISMSQTTACLTLSWLNDEGYLAFCESDFVIVPPGMFLYYLTGTPVYLHNSTFPHRGLVTCAHCTAPRRLDGKRYEPAAIMTHYESDYGAAPKVEIPSGQRVTFIDPEYASGRWLGFTGVVKHNPLLEICRTQQEVAIDGDWKRLVVEARDSHWVMAYGDHVAAAQYAARKIGIRWESVV
jgi:L-fucose isomerase-like protein